MTDIIQQMYKEYGITKRVGCPDAFARNQYCNHDCELCEMSKKKYPRFTAEKQIELIKLLNSSDMEISFFPDAIFIRHHNDWGCAVEFNYHLKHLNFDERFALAIIKIKPYIDNSKIKEILEK